MVNVAVIAIGGEVLSGKTLNTNAHWISQKLTKEGFDVIAHRTIQDTNKAIVEDILAPSLNQEIRIYTGGLGITCDDLTKPAICQAFNTVLEEDKELTESMKIRFPHVASYCSFQALVPKGAVLLPNLVGMAPGLLFETSTVTYCFIPGVPAEARALIEGPIMKFLKKKFQSVIPQYGRKWNFCFLKEGEVDVVLREFQESFSDLRIGIYPSYGYVEITAYCKEENPIILLEERLLKLWGDYFFPNYSHGLVEAIHQFLVHHHMTLSLAESCSGGGLSRLIVGQEGVSSSFIGSIVAYSNSIKHKFLGVSQEILDFQGAVSSACVCSMAKGIKKHFESNIGLSISGIAGPSGGTQEKPIGSVWFGLSGSSSLCEAYLFRFSGNRESVMEKASWTALGILWLFLNGKQVSIAKYAQEISNNMSID